MEGKGRVVAPERPHVARARRLPERSHVARARRFDVFARSGFVTHRSGKKDPSVCTGAVAHILG